MVADSLTYQESDEQYLHLLNEVPVYPIFIMGDHRSGTSLLYKLLDHAGFFNTVTVYDIVEYQRLLINNLQGSEQIAKSLLAERLEQMNVIDRFLDGIVVSIDLPEEYGFILDGQSFRPQIEERTMPKFLELCRKVQFTGEFEKLLLLKNPWEFTNFMYVKGKFPQSKFIFIHRHPVDMADSQIRASRTLYRKKSPYHALLHPGYERLWSQPLRLAAVRWMFFSRLNFAFRITLKHITESTGYFVNNIESLPGDDFVELGYEELCEYPNQTLKRVLNFLGVDSDNNEDYGRFIAPRAHDLLPEVEKRKSEIMDRCEAYMTRCGYLKQ